MPPISVSNINVPQDHFERLRAAYPGRKLLVVSNTSGATSWDKDLKQAAEVEKSTGIHVLPHSVKKPGCGPEIMAYFKTHPETGVTDPSQVAVVGDRLTTDMMLANMMGGWGFWVRDGVVPLQQKSMVSITDVACDEGEDCLTWLQFSRIERNLFTFLQSRGVTPPEPPSAE